MADKVLAAETSIKKALVHGGGKSTAGSIMKYALMKQPLSGPTSPDESAKNKKRKSVPLPLQKTKKVKFTHQQRDIVYAAIEAGVQLAGSESKARSLFFSWLAIEMKRTHFDKLMIAAEFASEVRQVPLQDILFLVPSKTRKARFARTEWKIPATIEGLSTPFKKYVTEAMKDPTFGAGKKFPSFSTYKDHLRFVIKTASLLFHNGIVKDAAEFVELFSRMDNQSAKGIIAGRDNVIDKKRKIAIREGVFRLAERKVARQLIRLREPTFLAAFRKKRDSGPKREKGALIIQRNFRRTRRKLMTWRLLYNIVLDLGDMVTCTNRTPHPDLPGAIPPVETLVATGGVSGTVPSDFRLVFGYGMVSFRFTTWRLLYDRQMSARQIQRIARQIQRNFRRRQNWRKLKTWRLLYDREMRARQIQRIARQIQHNFRRRQTERKLVTWRLLYDREMSARQIQRNFRRRRTRRKLLTWRLLYETLLKLSGQIETQTKELQKVAEELAMERATTGELRLQLVTEKGKSSRTETKTKELEEIGKELATERATAGELRLQLGTEIRKGTIIQGELEAEREKYLVLSKALSDAKLQSQKEKETFTAEATRNTVTMQGEYLLLSNVLKNANLESQKDREAFDVERASTRDSNKSTEKECTKLKGQVTRQGDIIARLMGAMREAKVSMPKSICN